MLYYVHFDLKKKVLRMSVDSCYRGGGPNDGHLTILVKGISPPGKLKADFLIAWVTVCPLLLAYKIQSAG